MAGALGAGAVAGAAPGAAAAAGPVVAGKVGAEALEAGAQATAVAAILGAVIAFLRRRRKRQAKRLADRLFRAYPEHDPSNLRQVLREELDREAEFERRMRERVDRDVREAMKIEDAAQRREVTQRILEREKRYTQMRERAMAERADARAEFLEVKRTSPLGAYWKLDPNVGQHTLDCIAMGEKFWPWEVLERIHPPLHPGCPCGLVGLDRAITSGWMTRGMVPDTKDAVRRAKAAFEGARALMEAARPEEITSYLEEITGVGWEHSAREIEEASVRGAARAVFYGLKPGERWKSGTTKAGQFKPRRGGTPGAPIRKSVRRALNAIIPRAPRTPADTAEARDGRWVWLRGRFTFIPEGKALDREIDGVRFTSPAGSLNVYRRGKLASAPGSEKVHPDLERPPPGERVIPGTPEMDPGAKLSPAVVEQVGKFRRESLTGIEDEVKRAVAALDVDQPPDVEGASVGYVVDAFERLGWKVTTVNFREDTTDPTALPVVLSDARTGSRVSMYLDEHGHVVDGEWAPGARPAEKSLTKLLDRPPESFEEYGANLGLMGELLARKLGVETAIGPYVLDPSKSDHAGSHSADGTIRLGELVPGDVLIPAKVKALGREMTDGERTAYYAALKVGVHETIHGINPLGRGEYQGTGKAIEEALTEELAHLLTHELLERQGLGDVNEWAARNPDHHRVVGSYGVYRRKLDVLFNEAKVAPEQRREMIATLANETPTNERVDVLADLLEHSGAVMTRRDAYQFIDGLMNVEITPQEAGEMMTPVVRPDEPVPEGGTNEAVRPGVGDLIEYQRKTPDGAVRDRGIIVEKNTEDDNVMFAVVSDAGERSEAVLPSELVGVVESYHRPYLEIGDAGEVLPNGQRVAPGARVRVTDPDELGGEPLEVREGTVMALFRHRERLDFVEVLFDGDDRAQMLIDHKLPRMEVTDPAPDPVHVDVGDTVRYDNRADGGLSEAKVEGLRRKADGEWVMDARTTNNSLKPGERVVLTADRTGGHLEVVGEKERAGPVYPPTPDAGQELAHKARQALPEAPVVAEDHGMDLDTAPDEPEDTHLSARWGVVTFWDRDGRMIRTRREFDTEAEAVGYAEAAEAPDVRAVVTPPEPVKADPGEKREVGTVRVRADDEEAIKRLVGQGRQPITEEELPAMLYHATVNRPAVEASGYLTVGKGGGLGAFGGEESVSFTTNAEMAATMADDMRRNIRLAHAIEPRPVMPKELRGLPPSDWNERTGGTFKEWAAEGDHIRALQEDWGRRMIEVVQAEAERQGWDYKTEAAKGGFTLEARAGIEDWSYFVGSFYYSRPEEFGGNPVYIGLEQEAHLTRDPDAIGVIEVPTAEAFRYGPLALYLPSMEEVRIFGDVAVEHGRVAGEERPEPYNWSQERMLQHFGFTAADHGDAVPGGYNYRFIARDADGNMLGEIAVNTAPGHTAVIADLQVVDEARRQGIATKLLEWVRRYEPDMRIEHGYTTPEGQAWRESLPPEYQDTIPSWNEEHAGEKLDPGRRFNYTVERRLTASDGTEIVTLTRPAGGGHPKLRFVLRREPEGWMIVSPMNLKGSPAQGDMVQAAEEKYDPGLTDAPTDEEQFIQRLSERRARRMERNMRPLLEQMGKGGDLKVGSVDEALAVVIKPDEIEQYAREQHEGVQVKIDLASASTRKALERAIDSNESHDLYRRIVEANNGDLVLLVGGKHVSTREETSTGLVEPRDDDNVAAVRHVGHTTIYAKTVRKHADHGERPHTPGMSAGQMGNEAILRHEFGHEVWDDLEPGRKAEFAKVIAERMRGHERNAISAYAGGSYQKVMGINIENMEGYRQTDGEGKNELSRKGNAHPPFREAASSEAFADLFAIRTSPLYDRDREAEWVADLGDRMMEWVDPGGEEKADPGMDPVRFALRNDNVRMLDRPNAPNRPANGPTREQASEARGLADQGQRITRAIYLPEGVGARTAFITTTDGEWEVVYRLAPDGDLRIERRKLIDLPPPGEKADPGVGEEPPVPDEVPVIGLDVPTPEGHERLYHGTTGWGAEIAERRGLQPLIPQLVAWEIEDEFGLPRNSVYRSTSFEFSRNRGMDPHVYVTGNLKMAREYASIRNEVIDDALGGAFRVLNGERIREMDEMGRDESIDLQRRFRDDMSAFKRTWYAEHDTEPVVLALDIPHEALERTPEVERARPSLGGAKGYFDFHREEGTAVHTLLLPEGAKREWLVTEEKADPGVGYQPDPDAPEEGEFVMGPPSERDVAIGRALGLEDPEAPVAQTWRQSHDKLIHDALHSWKGDPGHFRSHAAEARKGNLEIETGSGKQMRMRAAALLWEVEHNGRLNDRPLHRGSGHAPKGLTSWSQNQRTARGFAKKHDGEVYSLRKGEGYGLKLADYITSGLDEGEREWLILTPEGDGRVPTTPEIEDLEAAHAGGVADLGDASAKHTMMNAVVPGKRQYQQALRRDLRDHYGKTIPAYRAMGVEEYRDLLAGASPGPVSITTREDLARRWQDLPDAGERIVVRADVPVEAVVMRGKEEEDELVIDADYLSANRISALPVEEKLDPGEMVTSYHLTDNENFALDPEFQPYENYLVGGDAPDPGIYLAHDVEPWFNGYDYVRPFIVEIEHPPVGTHHGISTQGFLPATEYGRSRVTRVLPTDEWVRERYGDMGWFEEHLEDTEVGKAAAAAEGGRPSAQMIGSDYRYEGPDVREMPPEEIARQKERVAQYIRDLRPHMLEDKEDPGALATAPTLAERTPGQVAEIKVALARHIEANGPYAYHETDDENVPSIVRQGLRTNAQGFSPQALSSVGIGGPRPGHAYIAFPTRPGTDDYFANENPIRIDLRKLDPASIDSDEDHALDKHPELYDQGYETWGELADRNSEIVDAPDAVAFSIEKGSLAIRGGIPPEAIEANPGYTGMDGEGLPPEIAAQLPEEKFDLATDPRGPNGNYREAIERELSDEEFVRLAEWTEEGPNHPGVQLQGGEEWTDAESARAGREMLAAIEDYRLILDDPAYQRVLRWSRDKLIADRAKAGHHKDKRMSISLVRLPDDIDRNDGSGVTSAGGTSAAVRMRRAATAHYTRRERGEMERTGIEYGSDPRYTAIHEAHHMMGSYTEFDLGSSVAYVWHAKRRGFEDHPGVEDAKTDVVSHIAHKGPNTRVAQALVALFGEAEIDSWDPVLDPFGHRQREYEAKYALERDRRSPEGAVRYLGEQDLSAADLAERAAEIGYHDETRATAEMSMGARVREAVERFGGDEGRVYMRLNGEWIGVVLHRGWVREAVHGDSLDEQKADPGVPVEPTPGPATGIRTSHADVEVLTPSDTIANYALGVPGDGFGTGYYFVSTPEKAALPGREVHQGVDLRGLDLYKPPSEKEGFRLHDSLRDVESLAMSGDHEAEFGDLVKRTVNARTLAEGLPSRRPMHLETKAAIIDRVIDETHDDALAFRAREADGSAETATSRVMKALGWDGIDNREHDLLDTTQYGSVVFVGAGGTGEKLDPGDLEPVALKDQPAQTEDTYGPFYYVAGGCANLALAFKVLRPDMKIAVAWTPAPGETERGPDSNFEHVVAYDPKAGKGYDGWGTHEPPEESLWGYQANEDMDVSPEEVAEHFGVRWDPNEPWAEQRIFDAYSEVIEPYFIADEEKADPGGLIDRIDEEDGDYTAFDSEGNKLGVLKIRHGSGNRLAGFEGGLYISLIGVEAKHRRKGVATDLLNHARRQHPTETITHSMTTPDGTKWREALPEGWGVTIPSWEDEPVEKLDPGDEHYLPPSRQGLPEGYEVRAMTDGWFNEDGEFVPRFIGDTDTLYDSRGESDGKVIYFEGEPVASVTWIDEGDRLMIGTAYTKPEHRGKGLFRAATARLRNDGRPVDAYVWNNAELRRSVMRWQDPEKFDAPPKGKIEPGLAQDLLYQIDEPAERGRLSPAVSYSPKVKAMVNARNWTDQRQIWLGPRFFAEDEDGRRNALREALAPFALSEFNSSAHKDAFNDVWADPDRGEIAALRDLLDAGFPIPVDAEQRVRQGHADLDPVTPPEKKASDAFEVSERQEALAGLLEGKTAAQAEGFLTTSITGIPGFDTATYDPAATERVYVQHDEGETVVLHLEADPPRGGAARGTAGRHSIVARVEVLHTGDLEDEDAQSLIGSTHLRAGMHERGYEFLEREGKWWRFTNPDTGESLVYESARRNTKPRKVKRAYTLPQHIQQARAQRASADPWAGAAVGDELEEWYTRVNLNEDWKIDSTRKGAVDVSHPSHGRVRVQIDDRGGTSPGKIVAVGRPDPRDPDGVVSEEELSKVEAERTEAGDLSVIHAKEVEGRDYKNARMHLESEGYVLTGRFVPREGGKVTFKDHANRRTVVIDVQRSPSSPFEEDYKVVEAVGLTNNYEHPTSKPSGSGADQLVWQMKGRRAMTVSTIFANAAGEGWSVDRFESEGDYRRWTNGQTGESIVAKYADGEITDVYADTPPDDAYYAARAQEIRRVPERMLAVDVNAEQSIEALRRWAGMAAKKLVERDYAEGKFYEVDIGNTPEGESSYVRFTTDSQGFVTSFGYRPFLKYPASQEDVAENEKGYDIQSKEDYKDSWLKAQVEDSLEKERLDKERDEVIQTMRSAIDAGKNPIDAIEGDPTFAQAKDNLEHLGFALVTNPRRSKDKKTGEPYVSYSFENTHGDRIIIQKWGTRAGRSMFTGESVGGEDKLRGTTWKPLKRFERKRLGRTPETIDELVEDALGRSDEVAEKIGVENSNNTINVRGGFNGSYAWYDPKTGVIAIGNRLKADLKEIAERREAGEPLTENQLGNLFQIYKTFQHELNHGLPAIGGEYRGANVGLEESLTEESAQVMVLEWLQENGEDDVLDWARRNPDHHAMVGSYQVFRKSLRRNLEEAGIPEDEWEEVVMHLKFHMKSEERRDYLARRRAAHEGVDWDSADSQTQARIRAQAASFAGKARTGAGRVEGFEPVIEYRSRYQSVDVPERPTEVEIEDEAGRPIKMPLNHQVDYRRPDGEIAHGFTRAFLPDGRVIVQRTNRPDGDEETITKDDLLESRPRTRDDVRLTWGAEVFDPTNGVVGEIYSFTSSGGREGVRIKVDDEEVDEPGKPHFLLSASTPIDAGKQGIIDGRIQIDGEDVLPGQKVVAMTLDEPGKVGQYARMRMEVYANSARYDDDGRLVFYGTFWSPEVGAWSTIRMEPTTLTRDLDTAEFEGTLGPVVREALTAAVA